MWTFIVEIYDSVSRDRVRGATDPMGSKGQQWLKKKLVLFLSLLHHQSVNWMSLSRCCFGAAWEDLHVNLHMLFTKQGCVIDIFEGNIMLCGCLMVLSWQSLLSGLINQIRTRAVIFREGQKRARTAARTKRWRKNNQLTKTEWNRMQTVKAEWVVDHKIKELEDWFQTKTQKSHIISVFGVLMDPQSGSPMSPSPSIQPATFTRGSQRSLCFCKPPCYETYAASISSKIINQRTAGPTHEVNVWAGDQWAGANANLAQIKQKVTSFNQWSISDWKPLIG